MTDAEGNGVRYSSREMFDRIVETLDRLSVEIRETRHAMRATLRGLELRIVELEAFRREAYKRWDDGQKLVEHYVPVIDALASNERLSEALTSALRDSETSRWSTKERAMAVGLFLFAFIGAVGTVISAIVLIKYGHRGSPG